ncbi:MAG: segregation/condensation protein A [candidate division NC10 bacterium]|nr:segregation/condensation protein A [candidate division NC10 bacterium]
MAYQVKLEQFEGPLDLLLHLIRVHEIEITDIPIATITEEYFRVLTAMQELDLEVAGEFLVMAATLIYIKSKMLLPPAPGEEALAEEEDPRRPLVDMLLEYQRFKTAAGDLAGLEERRREVFGRGAAVQVPPGRGPLELSLFDLLAAFQEVLKRAEGRPDVEVTPRPFRVRERMVELLDRLAQERPLRFFALFAPDADRRTVIVTFVALLELLRQGALKVRQAAPFEEILIYPAEDA